MRPLLARSDANPTLPTRRFPILIVGAGGIVKDAHLPAYRLAGFPVWGLVDRVPERAEHLALEHGVAHFFGDLGEAIVQAPEEAVFDLALPASAIADTLRKLPPGSHVLIQKPMGENIEQAREIMAVCRERALRAAVNCQLRFAPFVLAARSLIDRGLIGDVLDMEMRLNVATPWKLFSFLKGRPRVEMVYHSIHYVDLIRSFLGEPRSIMARTYPHPADPEISSVRSSIILDYPDPVRALATINHNHLFGKKHQESYLKWEGTKGAIKAQLGVLMDYPRGAGDYFEYCILDGSGGEPQWQSAALEGSWFPHAFVGSMAQVMRHKEGALDVMPSSVEDVFRSMACIEAAYASNAAGGVSPCNYI